MNMTFSVMDAIIVFIVLIMLILMGVNLFKKRELGSCSACYAYKNAKKKQHGMIAFYHSVNTDEK